MKHLLYILLLGLIGTVTTFANCNDYNYLKQNNDIQEVMLLQTPLNVPVGLSRIEVQVVSVSVTLQRIAQHFIFSHEANTCKQNIVRQSVVSTSHIVLSLPPQYISYPFNVFW